MGEFPVREIDRSPFVQQGEDRGFFPRQQPVDRPAARAGVVEFAALA